jgi:hypothetical protein
VHWPQALVLAWMAISGLMEIALINRDLEKTRAHQAEVRDVAGRVAREFEADPSCDSEIARHLDDGHQKFIQSSLNAESNAKWKSIGFIFRVFAVRLVIMYALHCGGFF